MNPESMFDESKLETGKDRSSLIMVLCGTAVVIVVALVIFAGSRSSAQKPDGGWVKPGSSEFNAYAPFIKLTNIDKTTSSTMLGSYLGYFRGTIQNTGNRTLIGLRIRGVALGFDNETLAQRVGTPIPKVQSSLAPNESMQVSVQVDPIPDPNTIMDMVLKVDEFKLK